ncbi:18714_t:CDS:2, partial [Racocetra persica]
HTSRQDTRYDFYNREQPQGSYPQNRIREDQTKAHKRSHKERSTDEQDKNNTHDAKQLIARLNNRQDIGLSIQKLERINIRNNLYFKIIKEAKKLKIDIRSEELEEDLQLYKEGTEIMNLLKKKHRPSFGQEKVINIFTLEQILDSKGALLLT